MQRNLDSRELATVLAALRYWQRVGMKDLDCSESAIATDDYELERMELDEIDALCISINCGCEADRSF